MLPAGAINKLPGLDLKMVSDATTEGLYRSIRDHLPSLIPGLLPNDIFTMSLGLSHSLSRHKLKFSPDKVDTMIVQAISLLDDLDKELNTYAMRVKEWYGWHFPEMGRIVNDNLAYARVILKMGIRTNAAKTDLAEILPEEIETAVKAAAEVSMGTEITEEDLDNIQALAEQVVGFTEYRSQLSSYLSARMKAIAPNLTELVGELVGARLISHAGSLMNLAKSPASTLQILGAEKALFRALKTKHDTPKYGLIYHASLIGQATGKNKGKMARMLATKTALGLRVDALSEWGAEGEGKGDQVTEEEKSLISVLNREKLERRLAVLEGRPLRSRGVAIAPNGATFQPAKFEIKEALKYNQDADGLTGNEAPAKELKKEKKVKKLIEEVDDEPKSKKAKMEKMDGIKSIQEVVKDAVEEEMEESDEEGESPDVEMEQASEPESEAEEDDEDEAEEEVEEDDEEEADEEAEDDAVAPKAQEKSNGVKKDANGDDISETISTVSDDTADSAPSPTQQEINWQSKIEGNTKLAKKARKKERHARRLALSDERSASRQKERARLARRLDRKERRQKRAEQIERREERQASNFGDLAKAAGLSVARYQRKLERGEIRFEADGTPVAISKKDIKKARKAAEKAGGMTVGVEDDGSSKKRKRESEGGNGPEEGGKEKEKKKKKKSKTVEA